MITRPFRGKKAIITKNMTALSCERSNETLTDILQLSYHKAHEREQFKVHANVRSEKHPWFCICGYLAHFEAKFHK